MIRLVIFRVLKRDGVVYAETPFMQQVHEGAHDFTRFTVTGHRYLFKKFSQITIGGLGGTEIVLAWSIKYFFWSILRNRKLSSLNLSRTIEDSGTVTSVLIPWNTCGAYQAGVLNVSVLDYFIYAIFNWLSPITTLIIASIGFKIKKLNEK